jgi:UDP:flavonoid glycosyltransferase YjiC (YdhE family)
MTGLASLQGKAAGRKRILFVAEAVTLAHVARPLVLAQGLDKDRYDVTLAVDPRYEKLYASSEIPRVTISSIPSSQFAKALRSGRPLYSARELEAYVQADLKLISDLKPDVAVGDMRLSLAASARLARVPYVNLTNAYWSPFARVSFPIPQTPMTGLFGLKLSQKLFDHLRPMIFSLHTRP